MFGGKKQQKGWKPAKQAAANADKAHRREAFKQAKQGKISAAELRRRQRGRG